MTPREVWSGYDPVSAPLENSIISVDTDDNIVRAEHLFTVETLKQGRIRAYAKVYYDNRWADKRATVLLLPDITPQKTDGVVKDLLGEGYVVCVADYYGASEGERTTFPDEVAFAAYPACLDRLDSIGDSARTTPWFVWNKVVRRLITLLCNQKIVEASRIALMGIGVGADLAWQVAGMDNRVSALVPICGGGYRWAFSKPRFVYGNVPSSDEEIAYSTGVGAESYAKYITAPTLYIASKNATVCDPDRAGDILATVSGEVKQLVISESAQQQITEDAFNTALIWLRNNLALGTDFCVQPTLAFEATEGKLYLRYNSVHTAVNESLWVSYGEADPSSRHWTRLDSPQKVAENQFIVQLSVTDPSDTVFAYATFEYEDGSQASTPIQGVIPAKIGVVATVESKGTARVIYDGNMGIGSFLAHTDEAVLPRDTLRQAKGPFNINGISVTHGLLLICRDAREGMLLRDKPALHFDAYAPTARTISVSVYTTDSERKKYTARRALEGGEYWQKLLFEPFDFKSEEGRSLMRFSDTKTLAIEDEGGAIFNNFIWI